MKVFRYFENKSIWCGNWLGWLVSYARNEKEKKSIIYDELRKSYYQQQGEQDASGKVSFSLIKNCGKILLIDSWKIRYWDYIDTFPKYIDWNTLSK